MKKPKTNQKPKKPETARKIKGITHITLLSLLIISLVLISYAWIRNYYDLGGMTVKTGKMVYTFEVYARDSETGQHIKLYPASDGQENTEETDEVQDHFEYSLGADISLLQGTTAKPTYDEIFYVVKKGEGSIDLDVSLRFAIEEENTTELQNAFVGAVQYQTQIELLSSFKEATYFGSSLQENDSPLQSVSLLAEDKTVQTSLTTSECCVLRLKFDASNTAPQLADLEFALRARLGICQAGAPSDGETGAAVHAVNNATDLSNAMLNYRSGDTIRINESFEYEEDLVFIRPCTLLVASGKTFTLYGNMMFSYRYDGKFEINTISGGQIIIAARQTVTTTPKEDGGVTATATESGGNLYIDAPYAAFEFNGANVAGSNLWDMFVEGTVTVQASAPSTRNEIAEEYESRTYGVSFRHMNIGSADAYTNIYEVEQEDGSTTNQWSTLITEIKTIKDITVSGETRVWLDSLTEVGKITADSDCKRIIIVNNGTIAGIDLRDMPLDSTFVAIDNIYIDNRFTLKDEWVVLPDWSYKREDPDASEDNPNTEIIATSGLGTVKAVTESHLENKETPPSDNAFYSKGEAGITPDDITYLGRESLVEFWKETNDAVADTTKIIVHYEALTDETLAEIGSGQYTIDGGSTVNLRDAQTLQSFIEYYYYGENVADKRIAEPSKLTAIKIVCYGNKALTSDDYSYLQTLDAVVTLDLSGAWSTDYSVPAGALNGMASLSELKMSETDQTWGDALFLNTSLKEITIPLSVKTIVGKTASGGGSYADIRFVHLLSDTAPTGFSTNRMDDDADLLTYYFVPAQSLETYRNKNNSDSQWKRYIFAEVEGMKIYTVGEIDYALKLNSNMTCELLTCCYADANKATNQIDIIEIDFNTVSIDGQNYSITSYAEYALYQRLTKVSGSDNVDVSIDAHAIGMHAFHSAPFKNLTLTASGTVSVGSNAFNTSINGTLTASSMTELSGDESFYGARMTSVSFPKLTRLASNKCFNSCANLKTLSMPNLTSVTITSNDSLVTSCNNLTYIEIGIVQWVRDGLFDGGNTKQVLVVCGSTTNVDKACAATKGHVVMDASLEGLYTAGVLHQPNTQDIACFIPSFDRTKLKWGTASTSDSTISASAMDGANYLVYCDTATTATLVACLETSIVATNYTTPATFTPTSSESSYTITAIGGGAYRRVTMTVSDTLTFPDSVKSIGNYAFSGLTYNYGSTKTVYKINLNKVTTMDDGAFVYNTAYIIYGEELTTASTGSICNNASLVVLYLPKLSNRCGSSTNAFLGSCGSIRFAYVGASDNHNYDNGNGIWLVNCDTSHTTANVPNSNIILNRNSDSGAAALFVTGKGGKFYGGENFENVVFADWYTITATVNGTPHTIELPGCVFIPNNNGYTLVSVDRGHASRCTIDNYYTTPERLKLENEGEAVQTKSIEGLTFNLYSLQPAAGYGVQVTEFATGAYAGATIASNMRIGSFITTIPNNLFQLKLTSAGTTLDLGNVTSVGGGSFADNKMSYLIANKLQTVGGQAFTRCNNLEKVNLPAIETLSSYAFSSTALQEVILGENIRSVDRVFTGCTSLTKITVLNATTVLTGSLVENISTVNFTVVVPHAVYAQYTATDSYLSVPKAKYQYFEHMWKDVESGVMFYWSELTDAAAKITGVEGTIPQGEFKLPSTFEYESDTYTVTAVSDDVFVSLSGVTTVVLPDGLASITFSASSLPTSVQAFAFGDGVENSYFSVVDGVLYNKDQTILLLYPVGKNGATFTLPNNVTYIAEGAFSNSRVLQNLVVNQKVDIGGGAFANACLTSITFTVTDAAQVSSFIGRNTFTSTTVKIYVDAGLVDNFKANVIFDSSIRDMIEAAPVTPQGNP